mgnify:CR=1 FL=1
MNSLTIVLTVMLWTGSGAPSWPTDPAWQRFTISMPTMGYCQSILVRVAKGAVPDPKKVLWCEAHGGPDMRKDDDMTAGCKGIMCKE